jgi:hypothetical protein
MNAAATIARRTPSILPRRLTSDAPRRLVSVRNRTRADSAMGEGLRLRRSNAPVSDRKLSINAKRGRT